MNIEKLVLSDEEITKADIGAVSIQDIARHVYFEDCRADRLKQGQAIAKAQLDHLLEPEIFAEWVKQPEVQQRLKENRWVKLDNDELLHIQRAMQFGYADRDEWCVICDSIKNKLQLEINQ